MSESPQRYTQSECISGSAAERDAPLAMDGESFRRAGHQLVDLVAGFLDGLPARPVTRDESPEAVRALLGGECRLPEHGEPAETLLAQTASLLFDHSLFNGHPRFFGYITSSPAPIGILAELLAAAVNPNTGAWRLSPMASEIEAQTIRWIADLIGYPRDCGGLLVSGGNMANFVALIAARAARAGHDVRREGVTGSDARARVYASTEAHTWLQKATDMAGLGTDAIGWIPTDTSQRLDMRALREAIAVDLAAGVRPLMVVATAGTVSTGAVDPIAEVAAVCGEHQLWLHVDGAYGGFAAAVPGTPRDLQAISLADSVALDPHKWLYAPLEAGCLLVRDPEHLRAAFSYHPPYYHFGQAATNYLDCGPQNSRGFRALKVWLALRQAGRSGYVRMLADDIRLSERLHAAVAIHPDLEAATQSLSITTFRFVPEDLRARASGESAVREYLDTLTRTLLDDIQRSGQAFVSNAIVDGVYLLRSCIVNLNTTEADIDALPGIVAALGHAADARLRPPALLAR